MGFLNIIGRLSLRLKLPIREIVRRIGVSRNTVKKYLAADMVEPKFATPDRPGKLDPFAEKLSGGLRRRPGSHARSGERQSSCMRIW